MKLLSLTVNGTPIPGAGGVPTGGIAATFNVIDVFMGLLVLTGVILALLFLIWGGYSFITAEGDKQRLNQARQRILFSIIGLVVIFISFLIITLIYNFFNITGSRGGPRRALLPENKTFYVKSASDWGIDKHLKTLYI